MQASPPGGCIMLLPGMGMPGTMPIWAAGATPMPRPMLCWAMRWGPTPPPIVLGCTAKMLWPRSRRTCFLLFASSAALRLRAAAVARIHATRSATSLTFLHAMVARKHPAQPHIRVIQPELCPLV